VRNQLHETALCCFSRKDDEKMRRKGGEGEELSCHGRHCDPGVRKEKSRERSMLKKKDNWLPVPLSGGGMLERTLGAIPPA